MAKIVVLCSGGLDSTTLLHKAVRENREEDIIALTVFYGQKHDKELEAASAIARTFGISEHKVISLPTSIFAAQTGDAEGSSLISVDGVAMPHMTYQELAETRGVSPTYVPFRNANLISAATSFCMTHGGGEVWCGVHAEDARNWAYPDCTPEFIGAMQNAIYVGTYHKVRLLAPFQYMMKKDIVRLGLEIHTPYHLTWSCYEGREDPCGKCPTCVERLEAFKANGVKDPVHYA